MPRSFTVQTDQHQLQGYFYPLEQAKGKILLVHGFGEHQGRYVHVAERMNEIGLDTYTIDLSGHGLSGGSRGDIYAMEQYFKELDEVWKYMNQKDHLPAFLYGHSMGALVAASYCLERKTAYKGVILSSPWFKLAFDPPKWQLTLAKLLIKLRLNIAQNSNIVVEHLSSDLSVGKAYLEDDLVHGKMTPRAFFEIYEKGLDCLERADQLNIPTLCTHGTDDRIIDIAGTRQFAKKSRSRFKAFAGAMHEPHNEVNQDLYINTYTDWLQDQMND